MSETCNVSAKIVGPIIVFKTLMLADDFEDAYPCWHLRAGFNVNDLNYANYLSAYGIKTVSIFPSVGAVFNKDCI